MEHVAQEYISLRSATVVPISAVSLDGVDIVDVSVLQGYLQRATLPERRYDNFDVVRSDFGETIAYLLLEGFDYTAIGYKGVRDRETVQQPDRGIDVVGVEAGPDSRRVLTLVLGEVKVSDDRNCPPGVVDSARDALRKQHQAHLSDPLATARKIFNKARRVQDAELQGKLLLAAYLLEDGQVDRLRLVTCCVLVRSAGLSKAGDCGSFRSSPGDYAPSEVRFITVRTPKDIETTVNEWHAILRAQAA